jgi:hypothetical protein
MSLTAQDSGNQPHVSPTHLTDDTGLFQLLASTFSSLGRDFSLYSPANNLLQRDLRLVRGAGKGFAMSYMGYYFYPDAMESINGNRDEKKRRGTGRRKVFSIVALVTGGFFLLLLLIVL